jgi:hypothetical protein
MRFWLFESAIALLFKSTIFAFESAITLTAESAIILGESIFWEWRSFFVMTKGDRCLGCEVRSFWLLKVRSFWPLKVRLL